VPVNPQHAEAHRLKITATYEHAFDVRLRHGSFAIGADRSGGPFRGFLPRKTTPRDPYQATVIAKLP
jgi:hypothetical protein